jgi:sigma-B regulation protein RsbU (phosphoserine phosphatase)
VNCDRGKIAQLFSNLLGNALTYGSAEQPVRVRAVCDAETIELSVANAGEPIPAVALKRLFQPFYRGAVAPSRQGLGLGLYIAHEIAKAHGGTLEVVSTHEETRFTFRMPSAAPEPGIEPASAVRVLP